ncbi:MAG: LamG-like jellyroll fold domain-containing protein, partial [Moraxellaceae bacterium]
MNKYIKSIVLFFLGLQAIAQQDTTWVQTFTFDSITSRRANFQFPASLENKRFEKVLMYYKLKCSPLTTWDQYNCGEWDYLTYTRIFDHTGVMDSVQVNGSLFKVNTQSPLNYSFSNQVYFDKQWKNRSRRLPISITNHAINGTTSTPIKWVNFGTNGAKIQWIITASDLANAGVVAGNIQGLKLNFLQALSKLEGVQIQLKSTNLSTLTSFETTGFTAVFNDNLTNLSAGQQTIHFSQGFNYDGTSNLIIELSFVDPNFTLTQLDLEAVTSTASSLLFSNDNGVFRTDATNYAEVNMNNVDLGGDVTISFWAKGNGSYGTSTSILEAVDSLNNRLFNIHMPWSDNTIYFDAGFTTTYDRISKAATANEIDNVWHHWAFVKKTSTGQMFIYKDGTLWHSGTGLNRPIGVVDRFRLGSNWNGNYQYKGDIDEFSIWTTALDAPTINLWKNKKIDPSHPQYAALELYYDFDDERAALDKSGHNRMAMCSDIAMIQAEANPVCGVTSITQAPKTTFIQGTYTNPVLDSVLTTLFPETNVLFHYAPGDNNFIITNNQKTYTQGTIDTLTSTGLVIGSSNNGFNQTLVNDTIMYFKPPYEVVNEVEIGRYITPYGIGFDLGPNGFTWIYDVTDYQKYLKGLVDLAAHNTQELLDLKFAFVEGIPARDVHDIAPIWSNYKSYTYSAMDNDQVLSEVPVILADSSEMFKIKTRFTGHGHNGTTNCCEWDPKDHQLIVNGVPRFTWDIWEESACGDNPNIGQGGTWPYAREGWCPGDMVKEYDHELTPFVHGGDTVLLDYDIEDVPANDLAQGAGNYIVAMDLVSYSAPNFTHDAGIVDILNPNNYEYYGKWNPTCSNPRIIIQNNGSAPLTSCIIRCWVTYGVWAEYHWSGNLAFLEKEIVEIPITDGNWWYGANPANKFNVQIYAVGGYPDLDEYAANNYQTANYTKPEYIDGPFYVWNVTNNKAAENKWKLIDANGAVVFQRTTLTNSTDYK